MGMPENRSVRISKRTDFGLVLDRFLSCGRNSARFFGAFRVVRGSNAKRLFLTGRSLSDRRKSRNGTVTVSFGQFSPEPPLRLTVSAFGFRVSDFLRNSVPRISDLRSPAIRHSSLRTRHWPNVTTGRAPGPGVIWCQKVTFGRLEPFPIVSLGIIGYPPNSASDSKWQVWQVFETFLKPAKTCQNLPRPGGGGQR